MIVHECDHYTRKAFFPLLFLVDANYFYDFWRQLEIAYSNVGDYLCSDNIF